MAQGAYSKVKLYKKPSYKLAHKVDESGIKFITSWEMFVPYIYDDAIFPPTKLASYSSARGYPTIGIGILISSPTEFAKWQSSQPISLNQAQQIFATKLPIYTAPVLKTKFPFTQKQLNAMVSFCYNVGGTRFKASGVAQALKRQDTKTAMRVLQQYRLSKGKIMKGLVRRRKAEMEMFNS